ncbi:MAG: polyprenyl synthetase family protein [Planctomycetota bacterium]
MAHPKSTTTTLPKAVSAPLDRIETALDAALTPLAESGQLLDAMRYAVLGGGKRIRPLLVWHWCIAAGAPGDRALPAACAIEFVHAFSLVHDDLPAMDDDDLRRGRPTLHRHAGEALAILAGDALCNGALLHILEQTEDPARAAAIALELARGTAGMVDGQVYDTLADPPGESDAERLEAIHRSKTGALITAACRMGVLSAEDHGSLEAATAYGRAIGLLFQVVDDLLDASGDEAAIGKRTGKDIAAGKLTYPGLLGGEASRAKARALHDEALAAVENLGDRAEPLALLVQYLLVRTH